MVLGTYLEIENNWYIFVLIGRFFMSFDKFSVSIYFGGFINLYVYPYLLINVNFMFKTKAILI